MNDCDLGLCPHRVSPADVQISMFPFVDLGSISWTYGVLYSCRSLQGVFESTACFNSRLRPLRNVKNFVLFSATVENLNLESYTHVILICRAVQTWGRVTARQIVSANLRAERLQVYQLAEFGGVYRRTNELFTTAFLCSKKKKKKTCWPLPVRKLRPNSLTLAIYSDLPGFLSEIVWLQRTRFALCEMHLPYIWSTHNSYAEERDSIMRSDGVELVDCQNLVGMFIISWPSTMLRLSWTYKPAGQHFTYQMLRLITIQDEIDFCQVDHLP